MPTIGAVEGHVAGGAEEGGVAEGEDAAVGADHPVALARRRGRQAHDRAGQPGAVEGPEVRGVAVGAHRRRRPGPPRRPARWAWRPGSRRRGWGPRPAPRDPRRRAMVPWSSSSSPGEAGDRGARAGRERRRAGAGAGRRGRAEEAPVGGRRAGEAGVAGQLVLELGRALEVGRVGHVVVADPVVHPLDVVRVVGDHARHVLGGHRPLREADRLAVVGREALPASSGRSGRVQHPVPAGLRDR